MPRLFSIGNTLLGRGAVGAAVSSFFTLKLVLGMGILVVAARTLSVAEFAIFSQLLVLIALLVTIATGGVQHGIIREIAAERGRWESFCSVVRAAFTIWAAVSVLLLALIWFSAEQISVLLVGSTEVAPVIPWLTLAAVGTGAGVLLCAILTGQGRPIASLAAQGVGLTAASALALVFLYQKEPQSAALGFSIGPLLTTAAASLSIGRPVFAGLLSGTPYGASIQRLIGFSVAFLITAALMPLMLIALRAVYLETFGLALLGFWLAANRISDVNTQILGLYLTQEYLPKASSIADPRDARSLAIRTFLIGSIAMFGTLGIFLVAQNFWIEIFLSEKFLPAAGFIMGYFVGDVFRILPALISYTALAKKRLTAYVAIETIAVVSMAILFFILTHMGISHGPAIAYAATYILMTLTGAIYFWWRGYFGGGRGAKVRTDQ